MTACRVAPILFFAPGVWRSPSADQTSVFPGNSLRAVSAAESLHGKGVLNSMIQLICRLFLTTRASNRIWTFRRRLRALRFRSPSEKH